jgi:short-subunit dehydrogenase
MELRNAVVIITGASSGLGAATARELARRGARVVLAARREAELRALADEIERAGGTALAVQADVSDRVDIDRLVQNAIQNYGRIDVLVNNAGINAGRTVADAEDRDIEQIINVNLLAVARCCNAVIPQMREQGRGIIVNIGSIAGEVATNSLYAATKFGVRGLSDGLRRELRHDKIDVVLIAPGFIRTALTEGVRLPMPGPEAVATAVANATTRPRRRIVVPWPYGPLMYFAKVFPWIADRLIGSRSFQRRYRDRKKNVQARYQKQDQKGD